MNIRKSLGHPNRKKEVSVEPLVRIQQRFQYSNLQVGYRHTVNNNLRMRNRFLLPEEGLRTA